jgi:hypothetical protein
VAVAATIAFLCSSTFSPSLTSGSNRVLLTPWYPPASW